MNQGYLAGVRVIESGARPAAGLCGQIFARFGADVLVLAAPAGTDGTGAAGADRAVLGAGKRLLRWNASADVERVVALADACDVVITCRDTGASLGERVAGALARAPVVCELSAFGSSGPLAGGQASEWQLQALAGLMDTTGAPDGPPIASWVPVIECATAVYAAAAAIAALRAYRAGQGRQRVEAALYDTAVTLLSTFLPRHFAGGSPTRMGNLHPSMAPWNAYRAADGWLLLCSASDDMWRRVCDVIGTPHLAASPEFRSMPDRVRNAQAADRHIDRWVRERPVAACIDAFTAASVPCGPVHTIEEMLARALGAPDGSAVRLTHAGRSIVVPGCLVRGEPVAGIAPSAALAPVSLAEVIWPAQPAPRPAPARDATRAVLDGVRVLEMGSYTTAPLAARQMGALGADVVKLEPPGGELSRASPPHHAGRSYLCTLSNSDKRGMVVDLRSDAGRELFAALVARADVLVENMKPGVLPRFGLDPAAIARLNPRLVYCSVSGYGARPGGSQRPAMDTTIQGAAGIMHLTRDADGVPYKTGASMADIVGGQFALAAVMAALTWRGRTGQGAYIDLSMQDVSAWMTQFAWQPEGCGTAAVQVLRCADGWVACSRVTGRGEAIADCAALDREAAAAVLRQSGHAAEPVRTVSEVAMHPHTRARELIVTRPDGDGLQWPLLGCPMRLEPAPAVVRRALGPVGADQAEVLRDWGLSHMLATSDD